MTTLEKLEVAPEIVRALRAQYVHSVEDLLALAEQPNEREALLEDMRWTESGLDDVVEKAQRLMRRRLQ